MNIKRRLVKLLVIQYIFQRKKKEFISLVVSRDVCFKLEIEITEEPTTIETI